MSVLAVIGAAIIYYLQLEWWWWLILGIAFLLDSNNEYSGHSKLEKIVNKLVGIEEKL